MSQASKPRHVDLYFDEWIAGQVGLSNAERGLYLTACLFLYSHGGSVAEADLRAACRDHGAAYKNQLATLLRLGKLTLKEGQITNKRCSNELEKAAKRIANARQNGGKGGRPTNENKDIAKPDGSFSEKLTTNHQPPTTNLEGSVDIESTGAEAPSALAVVAGTAMSQPPPPDPKKDLYDLGKSAIGPGYGGQITKLLKHHDGDVTAALYTMRAVAAAVRPAEYLGKILSGEASTPEDYVASMLAQRMRPDGSPLPSHREIELARLKRLSA